MPNQLIVFLQRSWAASLHNISPNKSIQPACAVGFSFIKHLWKTGLFSSGRGPVIGMPFCLGCVKHKNKPYFTTSYLSLSFFLLFRPSSKVLAEYHFSVSLPLLFQSLTQTWSTLNLVHLCGASVIYPWKQPLFFSCHVPS
jgi:hypothetical protein